MFWFFFTKLKNVLKIAKKSPLIYWVLFAESRERKEDPALLRSTQFTTETINIFIENK